MGASEIAKNSEVLTVLGGVLDVSEQHAFLDLTKNYDWDAVKHRLEATPELINVSPCNRWTALHQAAGEGNEAIVKYLLTLKASVNLKNNAQKTALDVACNENIKNLLTSSLCCKESDC